jgi:hypothetical protein
MKNQLTLARRVQWRPVGFPRRPSVISQSYAVSTASHPTSKLKPAQQSLRLAAHLERAPLISPEPSLRSNSNWRSIADQPLTKASLMSLFNNSIAGIRHKDFLSSEECQRLVDVVTTHKMVSLASPARVAEPTDL